MHLKKASVFPGLFVAWSLADSIFMCFLNAAVAELVDALDLGSSKLSLWRFDPSPRYSTSLYLSEVDLVEAK